MLFNCFFYSLFYKGLKKATVNRNVFSDFKQALDQFLSLHKVYLGAVTYIDAAENTAQDLVISLKVWCGGLVGIFSSKWVL